MLQTDATVDMVISDINMPQDGRTLFQKLQERGRNLFVIIVSAYGDMANIKRRHEPRRVRL